jgi:hypothetical protein
MVLIAQHPFGYSASVKKEIKNMWILDPPPFPPLRKHAVLLSPCRMLIICGFWFLVNCKQTGLICSKDKTRARRFFRKFQLSLDYFSSISQ